MWKGIDAARARAAGRRARAAGCALAAALLLGAPACKEHPLSGKDLNALKSGTIQENQGKITAEEEFRILGIQARTRSDYERQVNAILARPPQPTGTGSGNKKASTGG